MWSLWFVLTLLACSGAAAPPAAGGVILGPKVLVAAESGVELHTGTWAAGGERGALWLASVPRDGALRVAPGSAVRPLSDLVGAPPPPWAAINGGFYDNGPMGLVVSGGVEHTPLSPKGGSGVVLFGPNPAQIVHRDAWTPGAHEALQSIDRLVDAGASLVKPRANAHRDARSAVAITADRLWLVAAWAEASGTPTADGVQLDDTIGEGLTLAELAELLVTGLGATQALNLDGAVSTQMIVSTSSGRWTLYGERGTINGLVVSPSQPAKTP
jgi:hypothetical protein